LKRTKVYLVDTKKGNQQFLPRWQVSQIELSIKQLATEISGLFGKSFWCEFCFWNSNKKLLMWYKVERICIKKVKKFCFVVGIFVWILITVKAKIFAKQSR
jgi:hypothetical protein